MKRKLVETFRQSSRKPCKRSQIQLITTWKENYYADQNKQTLLQFVYNLLSPQRSATQPRLSLIISI